MQQLSAFSLSKRHADSLVEDDPPWSAPGARPQFRNCRLYWHSSRNGYVSGRRITGEVLMRLCMLLQKRTAAIWLASQASL